MCWKLRKYSKRFSDSLNIEEHSAASVFIKEKKYSQLLSIINKMMTFTSVWLNCLIQYFKIRNKDQVHH